MKTYLASAAIFIMGMACNLGLIPDRSGWINVPRDSNGDMIESSFDTTSRMLVCMDSAGMMADYQIPPKTVYIRPHAIPGFVIHDTIYLPWYDQPYGQTPSNMEQMKDAWYAAEAQSQVRLYWITGLGIALVFLLVLVFVLLNKIVHNDTSELSKPL